MPSLQLGSFPTAGAVTGVPVGGNFTAPCPSLPCSNHRMSRHRLALSVAKTLADTNICSSSFTRKSAMAVVKESVGMEASLSRVKGILRVQDLNVILEHFGESQRWREVNQLFDWMQRNEMLDITSYSRFIKYMRISRNLVKALQVYDNITDESARVNVSICNSILGCLAQNGRFKSSMKLFSKMKDDGLLPDLVTYSTLLAGCSKEADGYAKAMQLVCELESCGFKKDAVIYGSLISICASNNLCKEAEEYFKQMNAESCTPNIFHYSSLLNAYSVSRDHVKAEQLIRNMKSSGIMPNKVIWTTLLKVYVRCGLFDKSRELLAELESLGYAKDEMPYCLLMDNLAKAGRMGEAREVFRKMKEKEVKSDGFAYSIMISALCRGGLLQEAKQLARDFEDNHEKYDLVMLNTLLRAYCNAGDMDSVKKMLRKMDEFAITPDWNTFHILIKYFCREKLFHLAYQSIEDMHNKGHKLNEELCLSLMLQLAKAGSPSESFSVYNMLRYSNRNVRKSLHETMLNILVEAGLLKDAYVIVKDNMDVISTPSLEKFATSFMKSGNINLINDVVKVFHRLRQNVDMESMERNLPYVYARRAVQREVDHDEEVGLPARGKTFTAVKLTRYLRWLGHETKHFNVGKYRRLKHGVNQAAEFFRGDNPEGVEARNEVAALAMDDMLSWMQEGGQVGIFDATNSTKQRRNMLKKMAEGKCKIIFLETICNDERVIERNVRLKIQQSPDYAELTDYEAGMQDFKERLANYEKVYEPVEEGSYVKMIDMVSGNGGQIQVNNISGYLPGRIVFFLVNTHLTPRPILLTRHGESQDNVRGRIGGDSILSDAGEVYAKKLANFIKERLKSEKTASIWTSTLQRTILTAAPNVGFPKIQWRALEEINVGACDGMTYEEIKRNMPEEFESRQKDKLRYRYPRGESYLDVIQRLEPVIIELERQRAPVVVISHQAVLRALYAYFADRPLKEIPHIEVPLHTIIEIQMGVAGVQEKRYKLMD